MVLASLEPSATVSDLLSKHPLQRRVSLAFHYTLSKGLLLFHRRGHNETA